MDDATLPSLSFAAIDARIRELPEGPSAALATPRWAVRLYVAGAAGALLGLAPSLLSHFMAPQPWMAVMAGIGVAVTACACVLPLLQSLRALWREMSRPTQSLVAQMDHDRLLFAELTRWLARYPQPVVADHLRFARLLKASIQAKLGLLVGGIDRLGVLPAAAASAISVRAWFDASRPPLWLVLVGMFLALLWGIGVLAAFARLRIEMFEVLLEQAARLQESGRVQARRGQKILDR